MRRTPLAALAALALGIAFLGAAHPDARADAPRDPGDARHRDRRLRMVEDIRKRGVRDSVTLSALRVVPRHEFVPRGDVERAYGDHPLPIGYGQTISQPYIVAYMTEILHSKPGMKVLEVGTGSGYQAAVLDAIGCEVYTIEIFAALAQSAEERLKRLGYGGVRVRAGDGYDGWAEAAPFDRIIVTAAAGYIPPPLLDQLRPDGRMVIPVGSVYGIQDLILVEKDARGVIRTTRLLPVRFVPLLRGSR
ncbi:MAG TPA: protein-L-isoaspartate(D-aspartate) O-methyltransferase [Candidatus Eisenbacteria bacterium]|jgi:protein-L-isoaspartate(D-aspartate) O-methyltransferase